MDLLQTKKSNKELREKYLKVQNTIYARVKDTFSFAETDLLVNQDSFDESGYIVKYSRLSIAKRLIFLHGIQILLVIFTMKQYSFGAGFFFMQGVLMIGAIFYWVKFFNRKVRVRIDATGIYVGSKGEKFEWENIVMTFKYSERSGKRYQNYLVVSYYVPGRNEFEEQKIDTENLTTTDSEMSSAIEYFKRLHAERQASET